MNKEELINELKENRDYIHKYSIEDTLNHIIYQLINLEDPKMKEEQAWEVIHGMYGEETLRNNIEYLEANGYIVDKKPVIPQFVASWIEKYRARFSLKGALSVFRDEENFAYDERVRIWLILLDETKGDSGEIAKNYEQFTQAWINGYEVEQEQKYYIKILNAHVSLSPLGDEYLWYSDDQMIGKQQFTEEEIKEMNPSYWGFAVRVEEIDHD